MSPTEWFAIYAFKSELRVKQEKEHKARMESTRTGAPTLTLEENKAMGEMLRAERYRERVKKERANGDDS